VTGGNRNSVWAWVLVDEVARAGVREVCVAPGSRSSPLVLAFAGDPRFRLFTQIDERSAGFLALGMGKGTGRPAVVVTTSGTAVANLLPAVVEASWSEVPLLLLTADRPHRHRDADANQAIDQLHIFGRYVRAFHELAPPVVDAPSLRHLRGLAARAVASAVGAPAGPVHLNVPLAKPLEPVHVPGDIPPGFREAHPQVAGGREGGRPWVAIGRRSSIVDQDAFPQVRTLLREARNGVVVAGPSNRPELDGPAALRLAERLGFPLLADPLSGARRGDGVGVGVMGHYDLYLRDPQVRDALAPETVVRVGASPTSAFLLRYLEAAARVPQVVVDGGHRWKDHLAVADHYLPGDPEPVVEALLEGLPPPGDGGRQLFLDRWRRAEAQAAEVVALELRGTFFEGMAMAEAVEALPPGGTLFVSSSMPVRELDAFVPPGPSPLRVHGNRGASGIDGILSTALGIRAVTEEPMVAVVGDLAFLHDGNGLMAARQVEGALVIVLVQNDGGGIFHFLPIREQEPAFTPYFATPHGLDLSHLARMHGIPYRRVDPAPGVVAGAVAEELAAGGVRIVEVPSLREENRHRREEVAALVCRAVAAGLAGREGPET